VTLEPAVSFVIDTGPSSQSQETTRRRILVAESREYSRTARQFCESI
jgi:hypothetical protein